MTLDRARAVKCTERILIKRAITESLDRALGMSSEVVRQGWLESYQLRATRCAKLSAKNTDYLFNQIEVLFSYSHHASESTC